MHADLQRNSSLTRPSIGSIFGNILLPVTCNIYCDHTCNLNCDHSTLYSYLTGILPISGPPGMDSPMEANGRDTHMHTVSSGDPMIP